MRRDSMGDLEHRSESSSPESLVAMSGLSGLSDEVFAFALTLLVLDIRVAEDALAGDLWTRLPGLAPNPWST
jgi:uncharacterized membrane protein